MTVIDHELGEITRRGDEATIVFHRRLSRPLAKIWAALTAPERLTDWLAETRRDGDRLHFYFTGADVRAECRIVKDEPMRSFAWTWKQPDGSESLVRFDLEPDGDGCRLTLTESDLKAADKGAGNAAGWHAHLEALEDAADGVFTPWDKLIERERRVNQLYRDRAPA